MKKTFILGNLKDPDAGASLSSALEPIRL